jgi:hypothetical protein
MYLGTWWQRAYPATKEHGTSSWEIIIGVTLRYGT